MQEMCGRGNLAKIAKLDGRFLNQTIYTVVTNA
jgi:hypothetical protein